jgi:DNA-binding NarL/FixJ family response regulator
MHTEMTPLPHLHVLVLDDGEATTLDGLATAVAMFGRGRLELLYADHPGTLRRMADQLAAAGTAAVIVIDVDHHPEPKHILADIAEAGFPLVVVSDGHNEAVHDHALSVGAAAYLPTSLPAHEMISQLSTLPRSPEAYTGRR